MRLVLTLFMLAVFAMFIGMDNAEATLNLDTDTFLDQLEEEAVSLAPNAVVLEYAAVQEAEAETVSIDLKWPHEEALSLAMMDVQSLIGIENSTAERGSGGAGILPGGRSRLI